MSRGMSGLTQQAGGMNLGRSAEEEAARRRVALPFEHRGEVGRYQTADFRCARVSVCAGPSSCCLVSV